MRRFLAFDIETAKVVPDVVDDLLAFRPLGIACAAAVARDRSEPLVWHGMDDAGQPSDRMTRGEAARLVADLAGFVSEGYTLLTWNGLGFDLNVLAEESGQTDRCAKLAIDHVDMLFHVLCDRGHLVSLAKAAEGMGLPGKTAGISGAAAPAMWAEGRRAEVLDYCVQDVRATLDLAEACERKGRLNWITRKGTVGKMPLRGGWLTVREARALPLPDTSWMSDPPSREHALDWLTQLRPA